MWRGPGRRRPPPARPAPPGALEGSAGGRPPAPAVVVPPARGTQWVRGLRELASARLPHGRDVRSARRGARTGRSQRGRDRGPRLGGPETGLPTADDPTKTPGEPGGLGTRRRRGSRFAPQSGREAPSWGVGGSRPAPRRKSPLPAAARAPSPARPRWPHACRGDGGGAGKPGAPRGGRRRGMKGKLGLGLFRFTGLAARQSALAHEWPGERGPAARVWPAGRCAALRSQGPSPSLGPG